MIPTTNHNKSTHGLFFFPFLPATLLLSCLLLSCSRAPIAPPQVPTAPPASLEDILSQARQNTPQFQNLTAAMQITASLRRLPGKRQPRLLALYLPPDKIVLQVERPGVGGILRVIQNGESAGLYLIKAGEFYRGPTNILRQRPEILMGLEPTDLPQALLVHQALLETLETGQYELSPPIPWLGRHWRIRQIPSDDHDESDRLECRIDRRNGLPRQVRWLDPEGREVASIQYQRYALFQEQLFPAAFTLHTGPYQIDAQLESIKLDRQLLESSFSLQPPPGLAAQPLENILERGSKP